MLYAALVTLVLAAVLTPALTAWARRRRYLDIPNDRSLHVVATPRIGGVALVLSLLVGVATLIAAGGTIGRQGAIVLIGAIVVALLGLADDFLHLPPAVRLAVQTAVALSVASFTAGASTALSSAGWGTMLLSALWIVAMINAYNFMDGVDGIAGVQAVVAGAGWAVFGALVGSSEGSVLGLLLASTSAGFLLHNWHPAKVFMGDAGSGFLGYMFAALPLVAPDGHTTGWWCSAVLVWPFVFDTGFTLLRRARRGENLLKAHRSHIYQRFVLTGSSHREITLVYGALAVLGVLSAISIATRHAVASLLSGSAILIAAGTLWWTLTLRERDASPPARGEPVR